ncbi:MAG: stage III sporulation protein AF [Clostridia bacterium]
MLAKLSVWAIAVIGVVILTVLVDIIIPDGQTNKYIKGIMAIIVIFVIIQPLPIIFNSNLADLTTSDNQDPITIDTNFIEFVNNLSAQERENSLIIYLESKGYKKVECQIVYANSNNIRLVEKVLLNLNNLVIDKNISHINIKEKIIDITAKFLSIEKGQVMIY